MAEKSWCAQCGNAEAQAKFGKCHYHRKVDHDEVMFLVRKQAECAVESIAKKMEAKILSEYIGSIPCYRTQEIITSSASLKLYAHPETPNIRAGLEMFVTGGGGNGMIILDQTQADLLIGWLACFVETGNLPPNNMQKTA